MADSTHKVRTADFSLYSEVRQLLTILAGVPKKGVTQMVQAIWDQTGTPQNPVDWSDPDSWIAERLTGEDADLARKIWEGSKRTANPRHISGTFSFINTYNLLTLDAQGVYRLEERGQAFLKEEAEMLKELDDIEGVPIPLNPQTGKRLDYRLKDDVGYLSAETINSAREIC